MQNLEHKLISNGFVLEERVKIANSDYNLEVSELLSDTASGMVKKAILKSMLADLLQRV